MEDAYVTHRDEGWDERRFSSPGATSLAAFEQFAALGKFLLDLLVQGVQGKSNLDQIVESFSCVMLRTPSPGPGNAWIRVQRPRCFEHFAEGTFRHQILATRLNQQGAPGELTLGVSLGASDLGRQIEHASQIAAERCETRRSEKSSDGIAKPRHKPRQWRPDLRQTSRGRPPYFP